MKADELMLGDLVSVSVDGCTCIAKVVCTDSHTCIVDIQGRRVVCECDEETRELINVEGIRINEDMLPNNGFTSSSKNDDIHYKSFYFGRFVVLWNTKYNTLQMILMSSGIEIEYVHEFQHILRSVTLRDVADNFIM